MIDVCGDVISTGLYFGEEGSHVLVVERESTGEESIEDYTTAPDVGCVASVLVAVDDLGAGVMRTTTASFELKGGWSEGGHSPVGEFYQGRVERMYEDIFGFEIAVDDRESVSIVETIDDLFEEGEGVEGRETTTVDEEIEQFAALDVFEYQIEFVFAFKDIVYAQYVGVVHELHHDDFPVDSETLFFGFCEVGGQGSAGVHEWLEWEYFYGGQFSGATVFCDADTTAGAFPDALANDPLADVFWVLGEIERTDASGGLFLLPASAEMGVVLDWWCCWGSVGRRAHCLDRL